VLNPAGFFETRIWNMLNYVAFAKLWLDEFPQTRFLLLGTSFIASKADLLKEQLGDRVINLVDKTTPSVALAVLHNARLVLSEDSGLMHMAWCSGVPTMGCIGGTRNRLWYEWLGEHTDSLILLIFHVVGVCYPFVNSCDVHCLTRFTPELVFQNSTFTDPEIK
jgi:ADP-heptose:LPS heptosyltransferase